MYGLQPWCNVIRSAYLYQLAISYTYKLDYAAPINVINTSHFLLMLPVDLFPNAHNRFPLLTKKQLRPPFWSGVQPMQSANPMKDNYYIMCFRFSLLSCGLKCWRLGIFLVWLYLPKHKQPTPLGFSNILINVICFDRLWYNYIVTVNQLN